MEFILRKILEQLTGIEPVTSSPPAADALPQSNKKIVVFGLENVKFLGKFLSC